MNRSAMKSYSISGGLLLCVHLSLQLCSPNEVAVLTNPEFSDSSLPLNSTGKDATEENVHFVLYTKKNPHNPQILLPNKPQSVDSSNFNPDYPTVFFAHGFTDDGEGAGVLAVKNAYMEYDSFVNFVVIDWCTLASAVLKADSKKYFWWNCKMPGGSSELRQSSTKTTSIPYISAKRNTLHVGRYAAEMISFLIEFGYVDLSKIHFTGHSLGAHVAGVTGYHVQLLNQGRKMARITGFDPALPFYTGVDLTERLDHSDAVFVDVIHSAGRDTFAGIHWSLGFLEPLGHVDFYPNKGKPGQPGCGIDITNSCSHSRSFQFYAESVNRPFTFVSCPCGDYSNCEASLDCVNPIYMGLLASPILDHPKQATFFTKTHDKEPYGFGECDGIATEREIGGFVKRKLLAGAHSKGPEIIAIQYIVPDRFGNGFMQPGYPVASVYFSSKLNKEIRTPSRRVWTTSLCPETGQELIDQTPPQFEFDYYKLTKDDNKKYGWTDFDRGHLTPLRDFRYDKNKGPMDSTNTASNLIPQDPKTNRHPWCQNVEKVVRRKSYINPGYVFTGVSSKVGHITEWNAFVPDAFFKLFCYKQDGQVLVVGFYVGNTLIHSNTLPTDHLREARVRESKMRYSQNDIIRMTGRSDIEHIWEDIGSTIVPPSEGGNLLLRKGHDINQEHEFNPSECKHGAFNPDHWKVKEGFGLDDSNSELDDFSECYEVCESPGACNHDDTIIPCAYGEAVVSTVLHKILRSGVFSHDYQFLFRLAYYISNFGSWMSAECPGGIWIIPDEMLLYTQATISNGKAQAIAEHLGIEWRSVVSEDLRKPIYSAIALRLYMEQEGLLMQPTIKTQAEKIFVHLNSHTSPNLFVQKLEDYYSNINTARGRFDMITILDGSGSVLSHNFEKAKESVAGFLSPFAQQGSQVRIGFIVFSEEATEIFNLGNSLTATQVEGRVKSALYPDSGTLTDKAIYLSLNMYEDAHIDAQIPSVSIVLTDGQSNNPIETIEASQAALEKDVYTFCVGIGDEVNDDELRIIAGGKLERVFKIDSEDEDPFDALGEIPLWLNVETSKIPIRIAQPESETPDSLFAGESRYYLYPLPPEGLTIDIVYEGEGILGFFSYKFDAPSSAFFDGELETGINYIPNRSLGKQFTEVYVVVQGQTDLSYVMESHAGNVEGCGFKGTRLTHFQLDPVSELSKPMRSIFEHELYRTISTQRSTRFSDEGERYIEFNFDTSSGFFAIRTKPRFSMFVIENRKASLSASVSFSCPGGVNKLYTFEVPVEDANNMKPEFRMTSGPPIIRVSRDYPLNTTLEFIEGQLLVTDQDYELHHANMQVSTNETDVVASLTPLWTGEYPEAYDYQITLCFASQPEPGNRTVLVKANDMLHFVSFYVEIQIS